MYLPYGANVSQAQIRRRYSSLGVRVSAGYLAQLLTSQPGFATGAQASGQAGLAGSRYAHREVTPTRVKGTEWQCHVLGGPAYVYYHTTPRKDRQSAISALQLGAPCRFTLNAHTWAYLERAGLPLSAQAVLRTLPHGRVWERAAWGALLDAQFGWLGDQARDRLSDAAAVGA